MYSKDSVDGKVYEAAATVFLCRCGGSGNKPFCDGSHTKNGFSDAKDPNGLPDRRDEYVGAGITVFDNRRVCSHSAKCTDNLKSVFKLGQEPWIDPDGDDAAKIAAAVRNCPSGALSYSHAGNRANAARSGPSRASGRWQYDITAVCQQGNNPPRTVVIDPDIIITVR